MRYTLILFHILILSCNQNDSKHVTVITDTSGTTIPASDKKDSIPVEKDSIHTDPSIDQTGIIRLSVNDSFLLGIAEKILTVIKAKDYRKLSSYVFSRTGLRFTAYTFVDTTRNRILSAAQLADPATLTKIIDWGAFGPDGSPARMNMHDYFKQFVYDVDFLHAPVKSVNRFHDAGTDLNNIKEAYPEADVAEFHFPGFDPKYEGLDFRTLRLVFITENKKQWLIGIVHSQWTP